MTSRKTLCLICVLATSASSQQAKESAPTSAYNARISRALAMLGKDLLVIRSSSSPAAVSAGTFDQDPNFYYFTGSRSVLGGVLVLDGGARRAELFIPSQLPGAAWIFAARQPTPQSAIADSFHVSRVSDWSSFATYIDKRLAADPSLTIRVDDGGVTSDFIGTLGTPLDSLATLANPYQAWLRSLKQRWPQATVRADGSVEYVRSVKDSGELAILRRVAATSAAAFTAGLARFSPGTRQRSVEAAVVETCVRLGGSGPSFWPWAMSGPNAAFPTPFTSLVDDAHLDRTMRAGEIARFDIGCEVDHYMGDVGRTVPVSGTFTEEQREVVDLLVAAYRAGLGVLREGATFDNIRQASVAEVARRQASMRTSLGKAAAAVITRKDGIPFWQLHGIGLGIAEHLPDTLRAGMVMDYEPIFVVDGQGFFMEDMILVTSSGYEILTKGLPYTADDIERAMRRVVRPKV